MNDPQVTATMQSVQKWIDMPVDQAKEEMKKHMDKEGGFSNLDYELLEVSESIEEAIGAVYGI